MIRIGRTLVSLDIIECRFSCDLSRCGGLCCVEGDAGAPLSEGEEAGLEEALPVVWEDLSPAAREVIRRQGVACRDEEGDWVTSIVGGRDCVFTCYDSGGRCRCAVEKAFRTGKTAFCKPVSCHLYPIRVTDYGMFAALNYHRWSVCRAAEQQGEQGGIPLYRFLKEPLIRRFGRDWYAELETFAAEWEKERGERR